VTDRQGTAIELDCDHRRHAVCELAIRDLKEGAGMNHCPSGRFFANAAWLAMAALAHNLVRWLPGSASEPGARRGCNPQAPPPSLAGDLWRGHGAAVGPPPMP
jgi:hypothetical protein